MERQVWRMARTGSIEHMRLEREVLPPPAAGEVTVRVKSVGLNLADVFACLGLYSATPPVPFTPGLEVAGVIEAVAEPAAQRAAASVGDVAPSPHGFVGGPRPFAPGDRVIALTRFGGYASIINADARYVRLLPSDWSFEEGAAFPVQALTAWYALHTLGRLRRGEVVLVHSAAGGVGLNALALVRACGATAVATVGLHSKRELLAGRAGLAEAQVIVRDRRRFAGQLDAALRAIDAPGFDIVLDGIAGPYFMPAFQRLRPEGRMVIFGASDMMPPGPRVNRLRLLPRYLRRPRLDPMRMISSNRSVMAFNLIWLWDRVERLNELYDPVADVLHDAPLVGRTFSFADAPAALGWLKSGHSEGKVVLSL